MKRISSQLLTLHFVDLASFDQRFSYKSDNSAVSLANISIHFGAEASFQEFSLWMYC